MRKIARSDQEQGYSHGGSVFRRALVRSESVASSLLAFNEAYLVPHKSVEAHTHRDAEEIFYILEGRAEMKCGEQRQRLEAGDILIIAPGEEHCLTCLGENTLRFFTILLHVSEQENF